MRTSAFIAVVGVVSAFVALQQDRWPLALGLTLGALIAIALRHTTRTRASTYNRPFAVGSAAVGTAFLGSAICGLTGAIDNTTSGIVLSVIAGVGFFAAARKSWLIDAR